VADLWNGAVDAFGEYLHNGVDLDPSAEIARRIERSLSAGRPASYVRLGDGEGNLLAAGLNEYPALTQYCARHASLRHFGGPDLLSRATRELLPAYTEALGNASLIGFPGPYGTAIMLERSMDESFGTGPYWPSLQGVVSTQRYLIRFADELELGSTVGASAGFNLGLLPHWPRLISGRRVGAINCHRELEVALSQGMGAADVDLRPVPGQARFAANPEAETGYWPERHRELLEELQGIEPGALWLVAAGLPGKVYCEVIRAAGGIAVDVGHTVDIWLGLRTRFTTKQHDLDRWRLV
jgi:hypothetical protein